MYSNFGAQAILGSIIVTTLEDRIGYFGFFMICLALTLISAWITFIYDEKNKFDYHEQLIL